VGSVKAFSGYKPHSTVAHLMRQQTSVINAIRAHLGLAAAARA
jgi:hypothetical protein